VLGHEFAATVSQSASPLWQVGQRVTGNPLITCGRCDYCLQGRDNLCANRTMVGMTRPGAFAERMSIPGSCLIGCPMAWAPCRRADRTRGHRAARVNLSMKCLVRPLPECRVLVLGGGAIGMLAALLLRHYGVAELTWPRCNPLRRASLAQHAAAQPSTRAAAAAPTTPSTS
jgi:threonine dehydrogenase-like Zn-dependent dehydrogenase